MADLTPTTSSCCAPEILETCCESGAKHACCGPSAGTAAGGTCGCSAGRPAASQDQLRESVRER
ncbi:MAG: hypothetical protein M3433_03675 [Actinomycetota bacterium]|nr:hypothetical protein [Actinomycetota bacterium]